MPDFAYQQERDQRKEAECAAAGIAILRIVEDAADLLTVASLRSHVEAAARDGGTWFLVRKGGCVGMRKCAASGRKN